ncbi:MAG: hypothetical protein AB7F28_03415 [Candidatus Margulisiibacteriota bacterium]
MVGLKKIVAARMPFARSADSVRLMDSFGREHEVLIELDAMNPRTLLAAIRRQDQQSIPETTPDSQKKILLGKFLDNKHLSLSDLFACVRVLQLDVSGDRNGFWGKITAKFQFKKQAVAALLPAAQLMEYRAAIQNDDNAVGALARLMVFCKTSDGKEISAKRFFAILETVTQLVSPEKLDVVVTALITKANEGTTGVRARTFQEKFLMHCVEGKGVKEEAVVRIVGSLQTCSEGKKLLNELLANTCTVIVDSARYATGEVFTRLAPFIILGLAQNKPGFEQLRFGPTQFESLYRGVEALLHHTSIDMNHAEWLWQETAQRLVSDGLQTLVESPSEPYWLHAIALLRHTRSVSNIQRALDGPDFNLDQCHRWRLIVNSELVSPQQNVQLALKILAGLIIAGNDLEIVQFIEKDKLLSQVSLQDCVDALETLCQTLGQKVSDFLARHGETLAQGLSTNKWELQRKEDSGNALVREVRAWGLSLFHRRGPVERLNVAVTVVRAATALRHGVRTPAASPAFDRLTTVESHLQFESSTHRMDFSASMTSRLSRSLSSVSDSDVGDSTAAGVGLDLTPMASRLVPQHSTPLSLSATEFPATAVNVTPHRVLRATPDRVRPSEQHLVSMMDMQGAITVAYPGQQRHLAEVVGTFEETFNKLQTTRNELLSPAFQKKPPAVRAQRVKVWLCEFEEWVETRTTVITQIERLAEIGQSLADGLNLLRQTQGASMLYAQHLSLLLQKAFSREESEQTSQVIGDFFFVKFHSFDVDQWLEDGFVETTGADSQTCDRIREALDRNPLHTLVASAAVVMASEGLTVLDQTLDALCVPHDKTSPEEQAVQVVKDWVAVGVDIRFEPAVIECLGRLEMDLISVLGKCPSFYSDEHLSRVGLTRDFNLIERIQILKLMQEYVSWPLLMPEVESTTDTRPASIELSFTLKDWLELLTENNKAFIFGLHNERVLNILVKALPARTDLPATSAGRVSPLALNDQTQLLAQLVQSPQSAQVLRPSSTSPASPISFTPIVAIQAAVAASTGPFLPIAPVSSAALHSRPTTPHQESSITTYIRQHPKLWTTELVKYAMGVLDAAQQDRLIAYLEQIQRDNPDVFELACRKRASTMAAAAEPGSATAATTARTRTPSHASAALRVSASSVVVLDRSNSAADDRSDADNDDARTDSSTES